jgi:endonuclease I
MKLYIYLFIFTYINSINCYIYKYTTLSNKYIRKLIINDKKMPSIYIDDNMNLKDYSLEHIYPICKMNNKYHKYDMHNIMKTSKYLNSARSNYSFGNYISNTNIIKLYNNNYLDHKLKLFVPNNIYKGMISRIIMYMTYTYNYDINDIIDIKILLEWYNNYPPTKEEIYRNNIIKNIQKNSNLFIELYNDSTLINRYINFIKKK